MSFPSRLPLNVRPPPLPIYLFFKTLLLPFALTSYFVTCGTHPLLVSSRISLFPLILLKLLAFAIYFLRKLSFFSHILYPGGSSNLFRHLNFSFPCVRNRPPSSPLCPVFFSSVSFLSSFSSDPSVQTSLLSFFFWCLKSFVICFFSLRNPPSHELVHITEVSSFSEDNILCQNCPQ